MKNKILFLIFILELLFSFHPQDVMAAGTTACSGYSTKSTGSCRNTCESSEASDGTCGANSKIQCCIKATPGICSGNTSKINGSCKKNGSCATTTEKADGTCTLESGINFNGMDCCVSSTAGVSTVSSGDSTKFTNPLTVNSAEDLLGNIMATVQKIIVTLALVAMIVGALMYVSAGVNPSLVDKAKETISAALIGLALAVAAPSLLKELAGVLGWPSNNATVNNSLTLSAIAVNVLNSLLGIFGVVSLIMMIVGAGFYLTSAGDEDRIDKGKEIFKYSVLGIFIAMSAMVLLRQIAAFFIA